MYGLLGLIMLTTLFWLRAAGVPTSSATLGAGWCLRALVLYTHTLGAHFIWQAWECWAA
ncbi:MAG: hypothetical protein H6668_00605 [Ardenticatenaceae bacterium]|nr:hypothetical protein [Ardenticatenaceae bacterium]